MRTVIEMAREVLLLGEQENPRDDGIAQFIGTLTAFAELVRADEREALETLYTDAHLIFNNPPGETSQDVRDVIEWYAASIRVRNNK